VGPLILRDLIAARDRLGVVCPIGTAVAGLERDAHGDLVVASTGGRDRLTPS
jgi:hypothetical protein